MRVLGDDEQAFLDAIAAARFDEGLRKVYADWLDEHGRVEEAAYQRRWTAAVGAAEDWLADFSRAVNIPYGDLIKAGRDWMDSRKWYVQYAQFGAGNSMCDKPTRDAFWQHWEAVTGRSAAGRERYDYWQGNPFSCDCGGYEEADEPGPDAVPPGVAPAPMPGRRVIGFEGEIISEGDVADES